MYLHNTLTYKYVVPRIFFLESLGFSKYSFMSSTYSTAWHHCFPSKYPDIFLFGLISLASISSTILNKEEKFVLYYLLYKKLLALPY